MTKSRGIPNVSSETLVRPMPEAPKLLGLVIRAGTAGASHDEFRLRTGRCVVGSGEGADLRLSDRSISRQHVELELVPEGVKVTDLKSRNGTFYGGQRITEAILRPGARLHLGETEIFLDPDSASFLQGVEPSSASEYRGLIGSSLPMRQLFATVTRLEATLVPVLIEGESGVGKELVAQAIHSGSRVSAKPIVSINCGAIPRELVASELFGHRKGAFTGAVDNRAGAFDQADGGTLFLDEVGELPLDIQPMLLRALETNDVRPVGADRAHRVSVRLVAATNRDLREEIRAGRFREDLYFRLAIVRMRVPPLRERREDIPALSEKFAQMSGLEGLPNEMIEALRSRSWQGNVRELRNAIMAFAATGQLPEEHGATGPGTLEAVLGDIADPAREYAVQKDDLVDRFTRIYLHALMGRANGNQSAAARMANIDRGHLGKLLVKHGLARN